MKENISKTFGIYQIKNLVDSKCYVGSTAKNFSKRWYQHRYQLAKGTNTPKLQNAWDKYGAENFEFLVLEAVSDPNMVLEREQYWLDTLQPYYNICPVAGNRLGSKASDETRAKMSASLSGLSKGKGRVSPMKGKKHTPEALEANRQAHLGKEPPNKGQTMSEEQRAKLSEAAKARPPRPWTEESRAKLRASMMGNTRGARAN